MFREHNNFSSFVCIHLLFFRARGIERERYLRDCGIINPSPQNALIYDCKNFIYCFSFAPFSIEDEIEQKKVSERENIKVIQLISLMLWLASRETIGQIKFIN